MSTQSATARRRKSTPALSTALLRSIAVLAGILGLAAIYGGSTLLISGVAHYQAQAFIEHWEQKPSAPTEPAWQIAHAAINRAIHTHPGPNGAYLETLGYIQQWRTFGLDLNDPQAREHRQAAAQALRDATHARPTWPFAWSSFAYAKMTLLSFDEEFTHALQQAQHFGPWRIGVNRRIAEIGLIAFDALNDEQRALAAESMRRTARFSTREHAQLLALAKQTHHVSALENALQDSEPNAAQ